MKEYIFYSFEGYTKSPTREVIENIQFLGIEKGNNQEEAKENLIKNNKWIEELGFDKYEVESRQLLDDDLKELIRILIDYNWKEEKNHYEENPSENHIFLIIERLKKLVF